MHLSGTRDVEDSAAPRLGAAEAPCACVAGGWVNLESTMTSEQKIKMDDVNEYPLVLLEITADSHPFYTGTQRLIDTQGRVDKFKKRYNR